MHGVCWRRSTLHIVHYSLHIEHCTMHIALERPLSGLRLACWPDFETWWCTSLELYNLSTSLRDSLFCKVQRCAGCTLLSRELRRVGLVQAWTLPCLDRLRLVWSRQNGLLYKLLFSLVSHYHDQHSKGWVEVLQNLSSSQIIHKST